MIVVVETIKAIHGKREELKKALVNLIPICRAAGGCLQYDLFEPVDSSEEFLVLMRWKNLADHRKHESSDYISDFVNKYGKILYGDVKVTEWKELPVKQ